MSLQKAHYAAEQLAAQDRFELRFGSPFFKEFVVRDRQHQVAPLLSDAVAAGYLAGLPLGRWYPELQDCFLVAVTEQRTRAEIDGLATCLSHRRRQETRTHA